MFDGIVFYIKAEHQQSLLESTNIQLALKKGGIQSVIALFSLSPLFNHLSQPKYCLNSLETNC